MKRSEGLLKVSAARRPLLGLCALVPLLMELQKEYHVVTKEHIEGLAEYLGCTPAHVLGVVTFYTMLSQKVRGRNHIYVCKTLSCHIRGAPQIIKAFEEKLGVKVNSGEVTEDGEFSLDTGECLGLCEQAPCLLVEDKRYGDLTPEMLDKIIEERVGKIDQTHTPKRLAQHWAAWEKLSVKADEEIDYYDQFFEIAQQVDAWFALIDIESGQLRDPVVGAASLCNLGEQLKGWNGRIYKKLSNNLIHFAEALFAYQPVLHRHFPR